MSTKLKYLKRQSGATLVEAALALPPLLTLAFLSICLAELCVSHLVIRDNMRMATKVAARVQSDGITPIESLRGNRLVNELRKLESYGMHVEGQQINSVAEGFYFTVELSNTCRLCGIFGIQSRETFRSPLFPPDGNLI